MKIRDFRSDTVTQPTAAMRRAMADAIVGDDILGEDPTVIELEQYSASLLGKEAGLFLPSGTMANQVAVQTFCQRGEEVLVGFDSHIFNLEVGALAALAQVQAVPLASNSGYFDLADINKFIRRPGLQKARTGLLCLENTYNLNGGIPLPSAYFANIKQFITEFQIPIYLDGARLFNAATALGEEPAALVAHVDAAMFCLTKGLAAPFGAVLVGEQEFIKQARWIKQRLGGGFRQIGHMAAAGLVALQEMRGRLGEDHARAQRLAQGLATIDQNLVSVDEVFTNIVNIDFGSIDKSSSYMVAALLKRGLKIKEIGESNCRMVTHHGISDQDVDFALEVIGQLL